MTHGVIDDRALVARAAGGSEVAYRELYRAYARPVYWIAFGLVGNPADAEDVVQETFVVAWRKIPSLRLEGESLLPWLATVCRLQAQNRLRARRRHSSHAALSDAIPSAVDVEAQVVQAHTVSAILAEVDRLSDLDREIFRLCAAEGYGYEAAAVSLGVSHGTVRNRLSRIRSRVRATAIETETP
ncbi:DNA-directed RNA polymerase sigma-70 factor [Microbacterium testaceum]|uniref:RNA polymerase sigma factor n=1 Tax=Microbacterium testaceum TaxID=2033 RepID=A0A4Y3QPF0_MICTE|nr:sigma-70 family RNA polymerase sigma factor [Microbacterium testaceum]GEB47155.1 DNA-directed RNA polymerase sigma-70 factor [Microbacterium testaceum]